MRPFLTDRLATAALFAVPVLFGLFSLALGQDANWDLRNYHWYNPYAFLQDRLLVDLGPAQIATYYNPLLDLPIYVIGGHLPARVVGFLLGCVHGLNYVLLYLIAARLLLDAPEVVPPVARRGVAAIVALVGVVGGEHLALVGTTFNDNLVSLAILAAAILILRRAARLFADTGAWPGAAEAVPLAAAGALIGIAVGAKLPTAPFAVGFCIAFLCVGGGMQRRFAQAFIFGLGVVAGFILAGAPWMTVLWREYANPLFPYFNGFFHSPMSPPDSFRDMRFLPQSVLGFLGRPLTLALDSKYGGEIVFTDYRLLAAYVLLWATAGVALLRRRRAPAEGPLLSTSARYVIAAAAFSYLPWLAIFGIYRYIVTLEMLAPVVAVVLLARWPLPVNVRRAAIVAVLTVLTVTTQRGDWEHVPWQDGPFVSTKAPRIDAPAQTLAFITGTNPVSWLVPSFPPEIPFLRIHGYLNNPQQGGIGLNEIARKRIAAHDGPMFILFPSYELASAQSSLEAYGLGLDIASCVPVVSNLDAYARWCGVTRQN